MVPTGGSTQEAPEAHDQQASGIQNQYIQGNQCIDTLEFFTLYKKTTLAFSILVASPQVD